jgi:hypothetical protein
VIALVLWLFGLSLYFILSNRKDIRVIPISLFFVAILTAVGPVSAFNVSKANQFAHLEHLLEKNKLIGPARDINDTIVVSATDYDRIRSIANYFRFDREKGTLEEWLRPRMPKGVTLGSLTQEGDITTALNFNTGQHDFTNAAEIHFGQSTPDAHAISGYDYYAPLILGPSRGDTDTILNISGITIMERAGVELQIHGHGENVTLTYKSIFDELLARRDSVLRAGGEADKIQPIIRRSASWFDLMISFRDASLMVNQPRMIANQAQQDSAMRYWGEGALFIKFK